MAGVYHGWWIVRMSAWLPGMHGSLHYRYSGGFLCVWFVQWWFGNTWWVLCYTLVGKLGMAISCMALCDCRCYETRAPTCQYCCCVWFCLLSDLDCLVCALRGSALYLGCSLRWCRGIQTTKYNSRTVKCYHGDAICAISINRHSLFCTGWIITVFFTVWLL